MSLMHLTISNVLPGEKLLMTDLGLIFTSLVPPCRVELNKGCKFVVSASNLCTVLQEELLMLLMIMFPRVLLGLLLTPPALKIYSNAFWKSTLLSPGTVQPSLLPSSRILFSVKN